MAYRLVMLGETISLKRGKRIVMAGRFPKLLPSKPYELWAEGVLWELKQCPLIECRFDYPVTIDFHFYRKTKRRFDFINMGQGPLDLMVEAGILADDDMNHVIPGRWAWDVNKENPRVEMIITDGGEAE